MRPIDADTLKEYMCNKCGELSICDYQGYGCGTIADIDEQPTIEAEPDNRWISVKHILPPYGERVLVVNEAYEAKRGYTRYNCGITVRDPHLNFTFWGHKVTHWQPLPKPPKGE